MVYIYILKENIDIYHHLSTSILSFENSDQNRDFSKILAKIEISENFRNRDFLNYHQN